MSLKEKLSAYKEDAVRRFGTETRAVMDAFQKEVGSRATPAQVGDVLPSFTLEGFSAGKRETFSAASGAERMALVFFRGAW